MAALWRSWHSGGFYKATHHKSFSVTVCNPAANFNQPPAVELSKVFFWVAPVAAALSFWNANLRLLLQTSRAARRNHRARTGAAFPAPPGATRSSTAPTPPTRRAAVSPCDVYIDVWNRVKIRKKKMAAPPVADQTDLVTQPCRLLLSPPPPLPLWRGNYCCVVFFFFFFPRSHRLLSLLQAGGEGERLHQLQLHLAVHPPLVDLRRRQRLRGLCRRDQLPGWAAFSTNTHTRRHKEKHLCMCICWQIKGTGFN